MGDVFSPGSSAKVQTKWILPDLVPIPSHSPLEPLEPGQLLLPKQQRQANSSPTENGRTLITHLELWGSHFLARVCFVGGQTIESTARLGRSSIFKWVQCLDNHTGLLGHKVNHDKKANTEFSLHWQRRRHYLTTDMWRE